MSTERKPVAANDQVGALAQVVRTIQLVWQLMLDPRVPTWQKLIIPGTVVLYVLSPIDLLPDFILGLGQVDDIAILFLGIGLFVELCPRHIVQEHRQALSGSVSRADDADPNVVEGSWRVVSDD